MTSKRIIHIALLVVAHLFCFIGCDDATRADASDTGTDALFNADMALDNDLMLTHETDMNWDSMTVSDSQSMSDSTSRDKGTHDLGQAPPDADLRDARLGDVEGQHPESDHGLSDLNIERSARRWAEAYCRYIRPCATGVLKVAAWADGDCIEQVYLSIRDGELARIEYGLEAALIDLQPDAISRCIDTYGILDCANEDQLANSRLLDSVCQGTIQGRLEDGQRCVDNLHCRSTLCLDAEGCNGICTPRSGNNEPCSEDCIGQCECEASLVCDGGLCIRPRAIGDMCTRESMCDGAPVFTTCAIDDGIDGQCVVRPLPEIPSVGDRCGPARFGGASCHVEHHCVYRAGTGTDQGRCERQFEGPGCPLAFPDMCPEGSFCDTVIPQRGARSAVFMGRCGARVSDGEACWAIGTRAITPESNCQRGLLCLNERGRTVGRFGPDDEIGRCYSRRALGTQCNADSQCASRRCVNETCAVPNACPD